MKKPIDSAVDTGKLTQAQGSGSASFGGRSIENVTGTQTIPQTEQKLSNQELIKRHCGLERLPEGEITKGKQIGAGGGGVVYRGTLTDTTGAITDIIVKESIAHDDNESNKETKISSNLMNDAKTNLDKDDNLVSSQEGFANVAFQQEINGQHVQRYIDGSNGRQAIYEKKLDLYNTPTGHPKNIQQSLALAQQSLNGIHALHEQRIAHCDIKAENLMIKTTENDLQITIINPEEAAKLVDTTQTTSFNCAPEAFNGFLSQNMLASTSQEDIYSAGTVLCELLFGAYQYDYDGTSYKLWNSFFWTSKNESGIFNKSLYQSCEKPELALKTNLEFANQITGTLLYPPEIFNKISDLIVKMCAIDPNDRPSAQECLNTLNKLLEEAKNVLLKRQGLRIVSDQLLDQNVSIGQTIHSSNAIITQGTISLNNKKKQVGVEKFEDSPTDKKSDPNEDSPTDKKSDPNEDSPTDKKKQVVIKKFKDSPTNEEKQVGVEKFEDSPTNEKSDPNKDSPTDKKSDPNEDSPTDKKSDPNEDSPTNEKSDPNEVQISEHIITKFKTMVANGESTDGAQHIVVLRKNKHNQYVMPLIKGENALDALLNMTKLYDKATGRPKDINQQLILAKQLCKGVSFIHKVGVGHGDLKLENVMIGRKKDNNWSAKIIDFDIATQSETDQPVTYSSDNVAPERMLRKQDINQHNHHDFISQYKADIYELGAVFCTLLFGENKDLFEAAFCDNWGRTRIGGITLKEKHKNNHTAHNYQYFRQANPEKFLRNLLRDANKIDDGSTLYPTAIYNVIEDLIVRMCDMDPSKRPSAEECIKILNILTSNCDSAPDIDINAVKQNMLKEQQNELTKLQAQVRYLNISSDSNLAKEIEQQLALINNNDPISPKTVRNLRDALDQISQLNNILSKAKTEQNFKKFVTSQINTITNNCTPIRQDIFDKTLEIATNLNNIEQENLLALDLPNIPEIDLPNIFLYNHKTTAKELVKYELSIDPEKLSKITTYICDIKKNIKRLELTQSKHLDKIEHITKLITSINSNISQQNPNFITIVNDLQTLQDNLISLSQELKRYNILLGKQKNSPAATQTKQAINRATSMIDYIQQNKVAPTTNSITPIIDDHYDSCSKILDQYNNTLTPTIQEQTLKTLKTKLKGKHHFWHNVKNIFFYPFKVLFSWNHQVYFYTDYKINQYLKQLQAGTILKRNDLLWIEGMVNEYRPDTTTTDVNQNQDITKLNRSTQTY